MKKFIHSIIALPAALLLLSAGVLSAQVLSRQEADAYMNQGDYAKALAIYKNIYAKNPNSLESALDLAGVYMELRNHEEAEKCLQAAVRNANAPAQAFCDLGDMLMFNEKYEEARNAYLQFAMKGGNPNVGRLRVMSSDSAREISKRPPFYTAANERRLSTRHSEFGMTYSNNGDYFVFTSDRPINYKPNDAEEMQATMSTMQGAGNDVATQLLLRNAQDPTDMSRFNAKSVRNDSLKEVGHSMYEGAVYDLTSEKEREKRRKAELKEKKKQDKLREKKMKAGTGGRSYFNMYVTAIQPRASNPGNGVLGNFVWTAPQLLWEPLSAGDHVGPCSFTPDGNAIYFSSSEELRDGGTISYVGIMISYKDENGGWSTPVSFPYNNRTKFSVGHPCLSKDGRTLYFASDMPGTFGGKDLFKCELQYDGSWGRPVNLGATINTIRDEVYPSIGPDGELYFCSNGHPGLGGLDIFRAVGKPGDWTGVENLRKPVNSSADDFSFTFLPNSKTQGVFSSSRSGGYGEDDMYSFKVYVEPIPEPKNMPFVSITVVDRADSSPVEGALLTLMNKKTKKGSVETSDGMGRTLFAVGKAAFDLTAQASGYLPASVEGISTAKLKDGQGIRISLPLDRLDVGGTFGVKNVNYASGKATLNKTAQKELDKVVKFLKDNPGVTIELGSHTDSRGSAAGNLKLSQQRADACVSYLKKNGIAANRIVSKGYGFNKPLIKNAKTEKQHAKNRRTEVKILEVK